MNTTHEHACPRCGNVVQWTGPVCSAPEANRYHICTVCLAPAPPDCIPEAAPRERMVYGTRINGRWCFVVNSAQALRLCEGDITTMDAECRCGENGMRLVALVPTDLTKWAMRCTRCGAFYPITQMPARQCVDGTWQQFPQTA